MSHSVFIVDDHPIVRHGLAHLVETQEDLTVVGQAGDYATALREVPRVGPDLALIDVALGPASGIDLTAALMADHPELKVLAMSVHDELVWAERALHAGARGYVMKQAEMTEVLAAIRKVLGGAIHVSDHVSRRLLGRIVGTSQPALPVDQLTDRELEVFLRLGRGLGTREVADDLGLSVKTIETYRVRIKRKLGLRTSAELLQHAIAWATGHPGQSKGSAPTGESPPTKE